MATRTEPARRQRVGLEWLSPFAIAATFTLIAQQWSGLDTPDSEFYASLAIFTDQVTDRAPIDSYYWTRLGLIAPVHYLTQAFGVWEGFALYKALLTLIITTSLFATARLFTGFWRATWLTAATAGSSVMLSYLGNTYITGSIMAGTAALIALGIRFGAGTSITAGVVLGWMAMTYPGGALLGGTIWLALVIYRWRTTGMHTRRAAALFGSAAIATLVTLGLFLLIGRVLFPGLDWLRTYVDASSFDYSVYSSGEWVWLTDISLLVPAAVLVLAAINLRRTAHKTPADLALLVSASSIGFILAYAPFFGAHFLEAPPSQAMLWPPAMASVALIAASRMGDAPSRSLMTAGAAIPGVLVIIAAGFIDPGLSFRFGLVIASVLITAVLLAPQQTITTVIAIAVFLASAQLLQNSREARGQFMLDPYAWAYQANPNEAKIRTAVNAQQWLIDQTTDSDQILLWVDGPWVEGDRELFTVASMQLWGENRLTLEPEFGDQYSIDQLREWQPTVIAMYGKTMDAIDRFYASLPGELGPTPPQCYDFTWPIDPTSTYPTTTGHLCLTRINASQGS